MTKQYIQVFTTISERKIGEKMAYVLVEKRLAGCVQIIGPIESTYRWQGKIETTKEWLCSIKSKKELYKELETTIKEIHPYETPEIVVTSIITGSEKYLRWLWANLK